MNKTQYKRLMSLADFLEKLPAANFDMFHFKGHDTEAHREGHNHTAAREIQCGTACCVAGWAAIKYRKVWASTFGYYDGEMVVGEKAFADFFGIPYDESYRISNTGFSDTGRQKAEQIRSIAKRCYPGARGGT